MRYVIVCPDNQLRHGEDRNAVKVHEYVKFLLTLFALVSCRYNSEIPPLGIKTGHLNLISIGHREVGCTVPGSTAIPGQCVEWKEQAPVPSPCSKNQFNIWSPGRGRIRY